jgi:hypothetical protein
VYKQSREERGGTPCICSTACKGCPSGGGAVISFKAAAALLQVWRVCCEVVVVSVAPAMWQWWWWWWLYVQCWVLFSLLGWGCAAQGRGPVHPGCVAASLCCVACFVWHAWSALLAYLLVGWSAQQQTASSAGVACPQTWAQVMSGWTLPPPPCFASAVGTWGGVVPALLQLQHAAAAACVRCCGLHCRWHQVSCLACRG